MEKQKEYPSIERHFPGNYYLFSMSRGHHMAPYDFSSLREQLYGDSNKRVDVIPGEDLHSGLLGWDVGVYETEIEIQGEKGTASKPRRVVITCFEDPRAMNHIPDDEKFHDGIIHHIFILKDEYDRADVIDAITDIIA